LRREGAGQRTQNHQKQAPGGRPPVRGTLHVNRKVEVGVEVMAEGRDLWGRETLIEPHSVPSVTRAVRSSVGKTKEKTTRDEAPQRRGRGGECLIPYLPNLAGGKPNRKEIRRVGSWVTWVKDQQGCEQVAEGGNRQATCGRRWAFKWTTSRVHE